jgi:RNA polymerase sigma factor (sigma-70 family)
LFGDDNLARRAANGDQRAFAAIYRRHHQELYRYCRAILHDPDDAQDALQATMVKALRALPGEEREVALKPWLFRIAHNEAISLVRARRSATGLDDERADPRASLEQQVATRERLRELVRDLDDLPDRQRGALVMRELNGLGFEDIGRVFAITPAAAKQAVYEARLGLQEIAEGREMECDLVREAISARDRRVLRGRGIRAHLRSCQRCSDFDTAIGRRRSDLAALTPPLALPAAVATLQTVLGGGAAGGGAAAAGVAGAGALGGGFGAGLGGGVALKAAVAVLATATVAGGAAELSGVVDLGGSAKRPSAREASSPPTTREPQPASPERPAAGSAGDSARPGTWAGSRGQSHGHRGSGNGHGNGQGQGRGHANSAGAGQSETPPGNSQGLGQTTAPGQATTAGNSPAAPPGQTRTPPGHSGAAPAGSTHQAHSSSAGSQASSSGQAHGGGTTTAPGQTAGSPGQSATAGSSANAPGHLK